MVIREIYKTKHQEHNQPQGTEGLPQSRLLPHKLARNSAVPPQDKLLTHKPL